MNTKIDKYRNLDVPVPDKTWLWNMYGPGIENIGLDGEAEQQAVPRPSDNQLLVRVDSVGMCFSDVKLIQQGGDHPKLYNRDLKSNPTRLGHEAALTVIEVGKNLKGEYAPGQRLAVQPDIYQDNISTAYGYTIPGGLTQFHLVGPEILDADDGAYVISVDDELGYAETALTEPWACVEAAYTQRRRLSPKSGGWMWIIGQVDDSAEYSFAKGIQAPATIVTSNLPESLKEEIAAQKARGAKVIRRDDLTIEDIPGFVKELTSKRGFDDIVILDPPSATFVSEVAKHIAFRGTLNIIGQQPLSEKVDLDIGRIHYHYTAYVGNRGPDIDASYGEQRNRAELAEGGTAVFIGAGGPMGQMHVQRAIEMPDGPAVLVATEVNEERLKVLEERFGPLAKKHHKQLHAFSPSTSEVGLLAFIQELTDGRGADDVVASVPVAALIEEAADLLGNNGMLVLFAGVPNSTYAPLDINSVYLHNAQFTGTSGSGLDDQRAVIAKAQSNQLSPNRSVAAIGGMQAARDGIEAMMTGKYAGKVVIFPQINELPLIGLDELAETYPEIAKTLGEDEMWTLESEVALIEHFWKVDNDK
ncbi:MAG: alcohol dehydrogenase [Chloroflexi bacterium]|nr:MAG: alcohol dehydrogenase [Chloroflexota bacterium]MBL1192967.1 alcohol dehydrogenase [Chloroflexota bacterium]NOH10259.1 zinc-binding dehydrogenase [Chloroflexota bacterium]